MDQMTAYIIQNGENQLIPLIEKIGNGENANPFPRLISASGPFGKISCTQYITSSESLEILQFESTSPLMFSFAKTVNEISIGYCKQGFFELGLDKQKENLLSRSQAYLFSDADAHRICMTAKPTNGETYIFLRLSISTEKNANTQFDEVLSYISQQAQLVRPPFACYILTASLSMQTALFKLLEIILCDITTNDKFRDCLLLFFLESFEQTKRMPVFITERSVDQDDEELAHLIAETIILEIDEPWSLGKLARNSHINSKKLTLIFKKYVGMPMNAFKISVRMEKAKQLLLDSPLQIQDISLRVGYSNPAIFSRLFKRRMGFAPSTLRQGVKNHRKTKLP